MKKISLIRGHQILAEAAGETDAILLHSFTYRPGDILRFASDGEWMRVQVDQAVCPANLYVPSTTFDYSLPIGGDALDVYVPGAFIAKEHQVRLGEGQPIVRGNLALNPADQRGDLQVFPHAVANVETRNESVFAARNVIDGMHIADGHGVWPFGSWGIGARTDAEIKILFGRETIAQKMVLYLRSDFPHDAWWIQGRVTLSNGYQKTFDLEKLNGPQVISLDNQITRWVKLDRLIKCNVPSAFPALRQFEVYGSDVKQ